MSDLEGYGKIYESTYWGDGRDNTIDWGIVYKDLGVSTDADYQAVLTKASDLGYTAPSAAQQELQNTLVKDLKSAGIWDKLDLFYCFATDGDSNYSTINWKDPNNFRIQAVNTPTFTTDVGWQGNVGNLAYLNTQYTPTSHADQYTLNEASFGFYLDDLGTATSSAMSDFGNPDVTTRSWYRRTAPRFYVNSSTYYDRTSTDSANTFIHANRSSSSTTEVYHNGVEVDSFTGHTANGLQADVFKAFQRSATYANSTISFAFVGGDLSSEASDFYDAINTYLTAI